MTEIIRKATEKDAALIAEIYEAIHTQEESGSSFIGWQRGIYPTIDTAKLGIEKHDMFVMEDADGIIVAARLNKEQCRQYADANWEYPAEDHEVMVMHTLVVHPKKQGSRCGLKMLQYYEAYAEQEGCRYLRIDTNEGNKRARAFYTKYGYKEVGIVGGEFNGMADIPLVCMEKKI